MKKLIIIGASGHGKVVADIAKKNGYNDICFLDDNENITDCGGYKVVGKCDSFDDYDCDMIVAIGDADIRRKFQEKLENNGKSVVSLIHSNAVLGDNVIIGNGSVVMAGAVVNPYTEIGKGCIINTCASVDHDNKIGDFVHISVGSHLAGTVTVGDNTWIGIGAVVSNNINIAGNCKIGAGAVVISDIDKSGTYVGVPAKRIK